MNERASDAGPLGEQYQPEVESTTDWPGYQDDLVRHAIQHAAEHAPEVQHRLREAGVNPSDIRGVDDLSAIPIRKKDDLPALQAEHPPFGGMLAIPLSSLRRIYQSPGPILDPEGDRSDFWRMAPGLWAAGFRHDDIVQNTFAYHLTPAGAMLEEGLRAIGCVVVPGGVGHAEAQVNLMARIGTTGFVGTPGFLHQLLERAAERGVRVPLRRAFVTGAALPPVLRGDIEGRHGVEVFQGYGTADCGSLGYECRAKNGWHVAPGIVIEIADPASGGRSATGEVVVTSPDEVYPMVRFGTGDLSAFAEGGCSCGRTTPRLVGFLGRVGEGVKVRGMFLHPRQLASALARVPSVSRYQARVGHTEHQDTLTLRVESTEPGSIDRDLVQETVHEAVRLRVEVEVVRPGTLPENPEPLVDEREVPVSG